jgi:hypothetical protein
MPAVTDSPASIRAVASAAAQADAAFFGSGALFLKPCSKPTFLSFVEKHLPGQLDAYRKRYEERAFVSTAYTGRLNDLVQSIRREYGLDRRELNHRETGAGERRAEFETQPWLPF